MVSTDSSTSLFPPHIQPPIAHVPSAMRDAVRPDAPISMVSMVVIVNLRQASSTAMADRGNG
jgi:hypothetical protein